jgi:hypothetical protein
MRKLVFALVLAGGIVLVTMGVTASESVASDVSRVFTGEPTDRSIWLLAGGIVATLVGIFGLSRSSK